MWLNLKACSIYTFPDSNIHVAHMGPTWVLSAPGGPHVGPMDLAIKVVNCFYCFINTVSDMLISFYFCENLLFHKSF